MCLCVYLCVVCVYECVCISWDVVQWQITCVACERLWVGSQYTLEFDM